jgi:hypothetical protein
MAGFGMTVTTAFIKGGKSGICGGGTREKGFRELS